MYTILIEKKVSKFLSRLDAKTYDIVSSHVKKLAQFRKVKNLDIKPLKGKYKHMIRLRIGSRRVLFTVNETRKEIKIWLIEDRGDVY
ncbi:hypothetical protein A3C28_00615 [Candidatus Roizmanbacteria bacterium RIFCSPHIGHO2_02_FULL_39_9]|uniref:Plasmid stabilization protein n=2 Tax=Candidatus Roizmaniibacteriota TaxID=1752723 RepID=A0A1F7I2R9_9BACT|nr:MAG: hypothetical protein A3C28_00615 [Candidatus Roizmanbacteria bacterium RIFCSPHIGHO2_02_FULL_39_9]OGK37649.1 MAG: hypothetical protein A3F60_01100 [Candidatus Roizmanbacteria bacterium RIFCSPHIGHO2_12_FULL_39_8]